MHNIEIEELPELLTVSEAIVRRAIGAGELPTLPDGSISLREAVAWRVRLGSRSRPIEKAVVQ